MSLFLSLLLLSGDVAAAEQSATPATAPAKAEKQICKRFGASESRMSQKKICKTRAEWRRMDLNEERVTVKSDRSGRSD